MKKYCRIKCVGQKQVPIDNWITTTTACTNRLFYVLGGQGGYILNDKKIPFKENHLYLIPGFAKISLYSSYDPIENRLNHSYTNFELLPPIISNSVIELDPKSDERIESALSSFNTICKNCPKNNVTYLDDSELTYFKSIVVYIVEKMIEKSEAKLMDDKVILKSLEIMHRNLPNKVSIAKIAEDCFMSTDGFIRKFNKHIGETPYSYLKKLKISTALNLQECGMPMEEIAEKCGYSDATTLYHAIENTLKTRPHFR